MKSRRIVVTAVSLFCLAALAAEPKLSVNKPVEVAFDATGPAGLKIRGVTHELSVQDEGAKVRLLVPLATIDTGIDLRNKHMREKYLETDKFPNAEFVFDKKDALAKPQGEITGQMTIHGVTKPVKVTYQWTRAGTGYQVKGSGKLNIFDFNIEKPGYLGVTVKPDVDFQLAFGLNASGGDAS